MQVEDNIRDMREAIPQCQSRISQRYLRVISLYLSLSYLSKCAAPYLPNTTTQTQKMFYLTLLFSLSSL